MLNKNAYSTFDSSARRSAQTGIIMDNKNYSLTVLLSKLEVLLNKKLLSLHYDQTFPSVIHGINSDGTYVIIRESQRRNVKNALNLPLSLGQAVWVKAPSGRLHEMHICGLR